MSGGISLDRDRTNPAFQSWRLGSAQSVPPADIVELPGTVHKLRLEGYDYLHTRIAVLRNHLIRQGGSLYAFLDDGALKLHRIAAHSMEGKDLWQFGHELQGQGLQRPALDCSLAEVQRPAAEESAQESALMLLSTGTGRLVLLHDRTAVGMGITAHDVAAPDTILPMLCKQAFMVEAAYQVAPGLLRCIAWAVEEKGEGQPARCTSYMITLAWDERAGAATAHSVQVLRRSKLPPHAVGLQVVVSPEEDAVALALDPAGAQGSATHHAPGLGAGDHPGGSRTSAMDEDDDVPSPRTLRAAAERLAQYTSEEVAAGAEPASGARFADLYSEVGPSDEAAAAEPDCIVYWFSSRRGAEPSTPSVHESSPTSAPARDEFEQALHIEPLLVREMSCAPHKLLAAQDSSGNRPQALLGLIDDVDCAVMALTASLSLPTEPLMHVATVPAFAYVTTGKVQRKFVLLGEPGASVAAVIVEAQKFAFVYRTVSPPASHGIHQVLDLGLAESDSVVGAALLEKKGGSAQLVVLTTKQLRTYSL